MERPAINEAKLLYWAQIGVGDAYHFLISGFIPTRIFFIAWVA